MTTTRKSPFRWFGGPNGERQYRAETHTIPLFSQVPRYNEVYYYFIDKKGKPIGWIALCDISNRSNRRTAMISIDDPDFGYQRIHEYMNRPD